MSVPFQPTNSYPSFAVAVMVTSDPSSKSPPSVETAPPTADAETDRVYTGINSKRAWYV